MTATAKSSKGVAMYLSVGAAVPATVVPTAISLAAPTEVTAASPVTPAAPFALQQVVFARDTGFPELDGKYFTIDSLIGTAPDYTGFTMLGSDTTGSTGVLAAAPEMDVYDSSDMVKACLNNFTFNLTAAGTIPAGTYCNPQATLPSAAATIGTATLVGWIDKDDPAYKELLKAEDDGEMRIFTIVLPEAQGQIIAALIITGITWSIPLEGGMGFTATADLEAKPRHLF